MALGNERYRGEFKSDQGVYYRIKIYDSDYTGVTVNSFRCDSTGFKLTYKGEGDERYQPIKSSSINFGMYIEGSSHETGLFVNLLQTAEQSRFKVQIDRGTNGVAYTTFWRGILTNDIIQIEDVSYPYKIKVKAVDGLSMMKDIPFNRDVYNGSSGSLTSLYTFENIVCNFLKHYTGGLVDFFSTTQTFVREMVHWYEDSMPTPGSSNGPWEYSAIYPKAFMDIEYDGSTEEKLEPISAYNALEAILKCWGLRIWQQEGYWHIYHVDMWRNDIGLHYYRRLAYTSSELGSGVLNYQYTQQNLDNVQGSSTLIKLAGGIDESYPPIRETRAKYGNWTDAGLFTEQYSLTEYSNDTNLELGLIDLGYVSDADDAYLDFNQRFSFTTYASGVDYNGYYDSLSVVYMLKVGSYYWDDDNNEWTTTQTSFQKPLMTLLYNYYLSTGNWVGVYNFINISFFTQGLPVSGQCSFNVQKIQQNAYLTDSYYDYSVTLNAYNNATPSIIQYLIDGTFVNERIFVTGDTNSTANEIMDLGELRIGDGPTTTVPSWGRIRVYNGSAWLNTVEEDWQAWQTGTSGRITKILTEENFIGQRQFTPLRQYIFRVGSDQSHFGPAICLVDLNNNDDRMVMNGYTFNAGDDTIKGEYFKTDSESTDLVFTVEELINWNVQSENGSVELM